MRDRWLRQYQYRTARTASHLTCYLPILFGAACRKPGGTIVEIGTDIGESTATLLAGAEVSGSHVWSIDINPNVEFLKTHEKVGDPAGLWTFICGDSSALTTYEKVPGKIDLLYVDGGHRYKEVAEDIRHYLPRVPGGGMALFHDTHPNAWAPPELFQVHTALDDLLPPMSLRWEDYPGVMGLGVVRVPVDRPCFFCLAQADRMFHPQTERQIAITGASPVEMCNGCIDTMMTEQA